MLEFEQTDAIGVTCRTPDTRTSLDMLLAEADEALYEAKNTGYGTGAKSEYSHVNGYTKRDGTYVAPHDRSTVDQTRNNNWSTKGNTNPETGKPGTQRGDAQ